MANTFKFGNGEWAVGKETALAYNDENSNFKPLPFTFDRASSATVVNKQGLIETVGTDEPRIDFLNNTKGHLLLEPSRSNLVTNSEQFVDAPTGNTNMDLFSGTITNNNTTSPDGNVKGMKFTISSGSGAVLRIYQSDLSTSANTTFSIYAKKGTTDSLSINIAGGTATIATLNDKWQRFSTTDTSSGSKFLDVEISGNAGEYIYIFGIQAEQGSYATSYIPTQGSAVTRSAERNEIQNIPQLLSSSGVIYAEIELGNSTTNTNSSNIRFSLNAKGSLDNWVFFGIESGNVLRVYVRANASNSTDNTVNNIFSSAGIYKVAFRYDLNNTKVFVNGVQRFSDPSSTPPSNLNLYQTGGSGASAADIVESVKIIETKLYNTALTDAELIALTS